MLAAQPAFKQLYENSYYHHVRLVIICAAQMEKLEENLKDRRLKAVRAWIGGADEKTI